MRSFWVNTDKHSDGSWTIGGNNLLDVFIGSMALLQGVGASLLLIWFFSWAWFWKISWFFAGTIILAIFFMRYRITVAEGHLRIEKSFFGIPYQAMDIRVDTWESRSTNEIELFTENQFDGAMRIELRMDEMGSGTRWLVATKGDQEIVLGHSEDASEDIFRALTRAVRHVYAEREKDF